MAAFKCDNHTINNNVTEPAFLNNGILSVDMTTVSYIIDQCHYVND